ncbi:MAG: immunoglobulin domain-containing protein [Verrucomicrobiales bacterium]|nr:immunoglobulin domain-containing protein [Verrucomicrobiales bacterium]
MQTQSAQDVFGFNSVTRFWLGLYFVLMVGALSGPERAVARLAITEAMSSAATTQGSATVVQNSDWWELTNFGTNTIDLTGYKWNDNQGGLLSADPTPFAGLSIAPGQSILFFQSNSPASMSPDQFKTWWGRAFEPSAQAVIYEGNGLSSTGDGIRLWGPDAINDSDWVDSVDFGAAIRGASFVYDPSTGVFGLLSTNGVLTAAQAATADDVGSPGRTSGPVPLVISQHPTNTAVNPGDTAVFSVTARGLPRPSFRWFFGDEPLSGERFDTLRVTNSTPDKTGLYRVVLDNGFQSLTSEVARLTLNAAPEAPVVTLQPQDQNAFTGQSVVFRSMASGVPQPAYQWFFGTRAIEGATQDALTLPAAQPEDSGLYSVQASNASGTVTSREARLLVTRKPRLVITEILPASDTNGPVRGHNDWWELSNLDTFAVDLYGYRFDDGSASLAAAITLTNRVSILPGESIVFVENMTPEEFRRWWGDSNFKPDQKIITYRGGGLSLSSLGDAINLWNGVASEDFDTVASEVFSTATNGVSFGWDAASQTFGGLSVAGLGGAWRSLENADYGSPGFLTNPPYPRILDFQRVGNTYRITWNTEPNRRYVLQSGESLDGSVWTAVETLTATGNVLSREVPMATVRSTFFRILLEP